MNKIILYLKKLGNKLLDKIIPEDSLYAQVRKNVPPPSNKKIIEEGGFVMDSKTGVRKKQRMAGSSSLATHYNELKNHQVVEVYSQKSTRWEGSEEEVQYRTMIAAKKTGGGDGKKDYLKNWEILELSMNGEHPSKILSGKRWVEYVEWKLNRGMIPGLDSKDCEVGTGGWGLGKCENQGIYQCPRCSKYCCENHKSWVRTYIGEPVCEPCSRDMQDY